MLCLFGQCILVGSLGILVDGNVQSLTNVKKGQKKAAKHNPSGI
jgi:hypothetical protein